MKTTLLAVTVGLLAQALLSVARQTRQTPHGLKKLPHSNPDILVNGTFDQLLDHSDPSKGTFKQRFWYDAQFWAGPGSPVFVLNPGEQAADGFLGYLENGTISGLYAQQFGGLPIVIEHRYWGKSLPFDTLTAETLQYLDLPQSVLDMTYFAQTLELNLDGWSDGSNADKAPWVLIGGSYPGALSAWTQQLDGDVFWAYHASSAVVEAVYDFYGYFDGVTNAIPQNCSNDIKAVIEYVDYIFASGNDSAIADLQDYFGLGMIQHPDDFALQIAQPLWMWQDNQTMVFEFCDYIETSSSTGKVLPSHPGGVGLDAALAGYAAVISQMTSCTAADPCNSYDTASNNYNDPDDFDSDRQWNWLLCHNPFAWWQVGPPTTIAEGQHVVSSLLQPEHDQRLCPLYFPETNGYVSGSAEGFTAEHLNMYTGGWDADFERVLFVNGEFDPWLAATVASSYRDGGPRTPTDDMPILTVAGGVHCPDMILSDELFAQNITQQELAIMGNWLSQWGS